MHLFPGDCIAGTVMMLVASGLLAITDPFSTKERGKISIILAGSLSDFERSDSTIFCFASAGLLSLLGGIGQVLVTHRLAETGKIEGHGVVDLVGLDIMDWVLAAVVGIRAADTLVSIMGFSTTLTLYCLLFIHWVLFLFFVSFKVSPWRFVPFRVESREGHPPGPLALCMSSSFWLKMGKCDIWKSRACMRSAAWSSVS